MQETLKKEALESVIESCLLTNEYIHVTRDDFDRVRAISPKVAKSLWGQAVNYKSLPSSERDHS